jgi:hypothetical protein
MSFDWRRELPPVIAVAGLGADYFSPAALWTVVLPFGAAALLMAMRRPVLAVLVFLLSSWIAVPLAAQVATKVQDLRGEHRLLVLEDEPLETLDEAAAEPCVPTDTGFAKLPVGPGHLLNPHSALRRAIVSFAELHNAILIERARLGRWGACAADR